MFAPTLPVRGRRGINKGPAKRYPRRSRRLALEQLEDRRVLAAAITLTPSVLGSLAGLIDPQADDSPFDFLPEPIRPGNIIETLFQPLPAEVRDETLAIVNQLIDAADAATVYHAFPGEVNEVEITSDLANLLLLLKESSDVSLFNMGIGAFPPVVADTLLNAVIPDTGFGINVGGSAGPLVVFGEAAGKADLTITGDQIRSIIKSFVDLSTARAMMINPSALLDFIPSLEPVIDVATNILNFDIRDVLDPIVDMDPIIDIDLPFGLPDIEIPPDIARGILDIVEQTNLPTSFRELLDQLPGEVRSIVSIVSGTLDFFTRELISDRLFISTLDRGDTISFPNLSGIPVTVYAGTGNDTIRAGNGASIVDAILDPFDLVDLGQFFSEDAAIELYGQGGSDTFIMGLGNSRATTIDGGLGNDRLVLLGTDHADIIEVEADSQGVLREVRFLAPDPNGNVDTDEVQRVSMPPGTTGGQFTLTFVNPQNVSDSTAPLAFGASAAAVHSALAALSNVPNAGDIQVVAEPDGSYLITFTGDLGAANQRQLQASGDLARSAPNVKVQEVQAGNPRVGINQIQRIDLPPNALSSDPNEAPYLSGGTFTLTLDDGQGNQQESLPLPFKASSSQVEEALNDALEGLGLGTGNIKVSGGPGGPWFAEFIGDLDGVALVSLLPDQPQIALADGSLLTGGVRSTTAQTVRGVPLGVVITLPDPVEPDGAGPLSGALGGTFTLTVGGEATRPLRFNATASEILAALDELAATNDVSVKGAAGGPWDVFFGGSGAAGGVTADPAELTGGVEASVSDTTSGFAENEVQRVSVSGATGGSFRLTVDNGTISRQTEPIPFDATAQEVQNRLASLGSVGGSQNVIVTEVSRGPAGVTWDVLFTGALSGINLPLMDVDDGSLVGGSVDVTELNNGAPGFNETQEITFDPVPTGGDFRLTFQGETTAPIPFNASPTQLRGFLEALGAIDTGEVQVSSTASGYSIEFVGRKAALDFDPIHANPLNLTGGFEPADVTFDDTDPESHPENEIQQITFDPGTIGGMSLPRVDGGTYRLGFAGAFTAGLEFDASASDVDAALESLDTIGAGNVVVTGSAGNFTIEFVNDLAATDVGLIVVDTSQLRRGEPVEIELVQDASLTNEIQRVALPPQVSGGTFTLSFRSLTVEEIVQGGGGNDELQTVRLPSGTTGGTFRLTLANSHTAALPFDATAAQVQAAIGGLPSVGGAANVHVTSPVAGQWDVEFVGAMGNTNVPLIQTDGSDLTGPFTTVPIAFDASAAEVRSALQALAALGGNLANNVQVTTVELAVEQTVRGRAGVNEIQSIVLPDNTTGGTFTLAFQGATTAPIDFDATAAGVEAALDNLALPGFDAAVMGNPGGPWSVAFTGSAVSMRDVPSMTADAADLNLAGGPWTIEFIHDFSGLPLESMAIDTSNVTTSGLGAPLVDTVTHGGNGDPILISTKRFDRFVDVEHLRIEGGDGDDVLRLIGPPSFPLGIMFEAGGGTDVLEVISTAAVSEFDSPVFNDGDAAVVYVDGQEIQFAEMEGELIYDANGSPGSVALSGTFAANEMRFTVTGPGQASFARDDQVETTLLNFAAGSSVTLRGEQGDDTIAVQLSGREEFNSFVIDGGGPSGADSIHIEGTGGGDQFTHTPGVTVEAGQITLGTVSFDYLDVLNVAFVGLGGMDQLTVFEALPDSDDTLLFYPRAGNDGSYQYTRRENGPASELVYPVVEFSSIEVREFDTGGGRDTFSISSDGLPGVNSTASVVGGSGVTTVAFGDQSMTYRHDITEPDAFSFEIGTADDVVDVTPGEGLTMAINTALGYDRLHYHADLADVVLDVAASILSQAGLGEVSFSNTEAVHVLGNGLNGLAVMGAALENRYVYTPLASDRGRLTTDQSPAGFHFESLGGAFSVSGGSSDRDVVVLQGSSGPDVIQVDGPNRTIHMQGPSGADLKPVEFASDVEIAAVESGDGDDLLLAVPAAGLLLQIDGGPPNASDRLVVEDEGVGNTIRQHQGPDERSGAIHVGNLPPVSYSAVEFVDIVPLDPVTGGTGNDGLGRIVVFHPDTFSHNNSRLNPTELDDLFEHTAKPNISPGGQTDPFGRGFDLAGDEDWYRYVAVATGTFQFQVLHEPVPTLANGQPGLPGDGQLRIDMYFADGTPIVRLPSELDPAVQTIGVDGGQSYLLRIRGDTPEAINNYDLGITDLDTIGPQVFDPDGDGPEQAVEVTGHPTFNLFDIKPTQGPTPPVHSLTVHLRDLPVRFPGFLYGALDTLIASHPGHFRLVGDHNGIIAITEIVVVNDPVIPGSLATATIELRFDGPLPDDRYTLTLADDIRDPSGNRLDGESNADQPLGAPAFPTGDGISGGDFVARFTVDSRPEIGTYLGDGTWYVDLNGNGIFDPDNPDATNRDIVWVFGAKGDIPIVGDWNGDGYDQIGVFGKRGGKNMFELDLDGNGAFDPAVDARFEFKASGNLWPIAGDWDGDGADEVGAHSNNRWFIDNTGVAYTPALTSINPTQINHSMKGVPVVGDWDGDGNDNVGTFWQDEFFLDTNGSFGSAELIVQFPEFDFGGLVPQPVAGDWDIDGDDDLGLFVRRETGNNSGSREAGEWFLDVNTDLSGSGVIQARFEPPLTGSPGVPIVYQDIFYNFGDEREPAGGLGGLIPIAGNFDPPVASQTGGNPNAGEPPAADPRDVNRDGLLSPLDVLWIVNAINAWEGETLFASASNAELDVNGDAFISAMDVLLVLNAVNQLSLTDSAAEGGAGMPAGAFAEGEGGGLAAPTATDQVFARVEPADALELLGSPRPPEPVLTGQNRDSAAATDRVLREFGELGFESLEDLLRLPLDVAGEQGNGE